MRPVRVLQVIRPSSVGMREHVLRLASGLAGEGVTTEIACPGDSALIEAALTAGITVHPLPLKGRMHAFHDPETVLVLRDIMKERRYDLVHAHGYRTSTIARLAARLAGVRKAVVTIHRPVMDRRDITYFTKKRLITTERWLATRTLRYLAATRTCADELVSTFQVSPRRVEVVNPGFDLEPFSSSRARLHDRDRYGLPHDAVVFGLAGRFSPGRGLEQIARAAVVVCERLPYVWFVLAGDGPLLDTVRKIVRDAGCVDRVLFPGYETDVAGLLSALDAYVTARPSERPRRALIEASAAGLPSVAVLSHGYSEVVEDGVTGLLVDPKDEAALADAILKLARDPALRAAMGERARERALERFSSESMLRHVLALYREVT
jgi:glycosyltransferase involved in cell wall biosynthesis